MADTFEGDSAPVTDRINVEPQIINGLSHSEVEVAAGVFLAIFSAIGLALWLVTGIWPLFVLIAIVGTLTSVWTLSKHIAELKRNRPDGYYIQFIRHALARRGLRRASWVTHDGYWSLGRHW